MERDSPDGTATERERWSGTTNLMEPPLRTPDGHIAVILVAKHDFCNNKIYLSTNE
jgi:hypothetical protein